MTERQAFIKAISLSPGDDVPRLIFADFLEETGGTVACERSSGALCPYYLGEPCPFCSGTGRVSNGNAEQAEIIRWMIDHPEVHWVCLCEQRPGEVCHACRRIPGARDIPRRAAPGTFGETPYVVHRGFVTEIRLPIERFTPADLFRDHPIERVVFTNREPMRAIALPHGWVQWRRQTRSIVLGDIPDNLVTLLRAEVPAAMWDTAVVQGVATFERRDEAIDWLSNRAVAFGRAAAWG